MFPSKPYERTLPDTIKEEQHQYRLVGKSEGRASASEMDMETQKMIERDAKLKKTIRRFRFVLRSVHLACRYLPSFLFWFLSWRVQILILFSIVVISLLSANFAVFYTTIDHLIDDNGTLTSAWGGTKAWPAIILLTVACVSAFINIRTYLQLPYLT